MSGRGRGRGRGSLPIAAPGSNIEENAASNQSGIIQHLQVDAPNIDLQGNVPPVDIPMQDAVNDPVAQQHADPPVINPLQQPLPAPLDLQTIITTVVTAITQANDARFAALEAKFASQPPPQVSMSKLDEILLRQLSNLDPFTGTSKKTWSAYLHEFRNKASQIPSLPKTEWLRYLHSHITDRALEYAKVQGLVGHDDALLCDDFEEYCTKMGEAMFGDDMTPTQRVQALASLTQTGKYTPPLEFLRGKEQLLNQIPAADMAGYVRAALTLQGMDPVLVQAITPNPASPDGQFHSYSEVRKQVVAVSSLNQQLLAAAAQSKASGNATGSGNAWQSSKYKGKSSYQHTASDNKQTSSQQQQHTQQQTQAPSQGQGSYSKKQQSSHQSEQPSKSAPQDSGKQPAKIAAADAVCKDCSQKGHFSKSYFHCPKNPKNLKAT